MIVSLLALRSMRCAQCAEILVLQDAYLAYCLSESTGSAVMIFTRTCDGTRRCCTPCSMHSPRWLHACTKASALASAALQPPEPPCARPIP